MIRVFIIIIFCFRSLISVEFDTAIGNCNLVFDNGIIPKKVDYISLIQNDVYKLVNNFGEVNKFPFEVYITNDIDKFKKLAKGPTPEWGVGIAKKNPSRIVIKGTQLAKNSLNRLNEILIHELNHIYLFRTPNYHILPKWFVEGFASYWADELNITKKIQISSALWEKRQFGLEGLKHFHSFHRVHANLAYAQSNVAINAIIYFYSEQVLKSIIHNKDKFNNFDELFKFETKDSSLEFTLKYEEFLSQNFKWIFLLKSSNILFMSLPIILVIGFIIRRQKNKLLLEKWAEEEKLEEDDFEENI